MSDLCAHGQSLLIWVFFEDPQGELTRNAYDDDDKRQPFDRHQWLSCRSVALVTKGVMGSIPV